MLVPSESMSVVNAGHRDAFAMPRSCYKIKRVVSVPNLSSSYMAKKENYWLTPKSKPRSVSGYGSYKNLFDTYWYDRRFYSEWPNYYYSSRPQYRKSTYEYPYSTWWYTAGPLSYPSVTTRSQAVDYLDPIFTRYYGSARPWWRTKRSDFPKLGRMESALQYHHSGYVGAPSMDRFLGLSAKWENSSWAIMAYTNVLTTSTWSCQPRHYSWGYPLHDEYSVNKVTPVDRTEGDWKYFAARRRPIGYHYDLAVPEPAPMGHGYSGHPEIFGDIGGMGPGWVPTFKSFWRTNYATFLNPVTWRLSPSGINSCRRCTPHRNHLHLRWQEDQYQEGRLYHPTSYYAASYYRSS